MMDAAELNRIRWRSRRGLLELDLILTRFLETTLLKMTPDEVESYKDLLLYPDNDLLDLVNGRLECEEKRLRAVVGQLQACQPGNPMSDAPAKH